MEAKLSGEKHLLVQSLVPLTEQTSRFLMEDFQIALSRATDFKAHADTVDMEEVIQHVSLHIFELEIIILWSEIHKRITLIVF
jgi:hypothetical protein